MLSSFFTDFKVSKNYDGCLQNGTCTKCRFGHLRLKLY